MTSTEPRIARFIDRVFNDELCGAALGGTEKDSNLLSSSLIARLFPTPVVQLTANAEASDSWVQNFEKALTDGKVVFLRLEPGADETVFKPLEQLLRDKQVDLIKPHGRVTVKPHEDFRLFIYSPSGAFPFDELVALKLRLD